MAELTGGLPPPSSAGRLGGIRRGAFVTLDRGGELRGCIGRITGDRPLTEVVPEMTVAAATDDPRFPPVGILEIPELHIEISVLTPPVPLEPRDPARIVVGRDGLLVERGAARGLLLPRVAPAYRWGPVDFLMATCEKAGLPAGAWREPGTRIATFQADVFGE